MCRIYTLEESTRALHKSLQIFNAPTANGTFVFQMQYAQLFSSKKACDTSPLTCVQVGQAAGASGRHLHLLYPELLLGEVLRGRCQREEDVWSLTWQLQGLTSLLYYCSWNQNKYIMI